TADNALTSLSAEKANQVITNWDALAWKSGSFYAATSATGTAPVAGHAFAGICYFSTASDPVVEATDITDTVNAKYMRVMTSGVWGPWVGIGKGNANAIGEYTFDAGTTFPPVAGQIRL